MWRLCVLCALLSPVSGPGRHIAVTGSRDVEPDRGSGKKSSPLTPTSANTSGNIAPDRGGESNQSSLDPGADTHTDVYARLGSDFLLPVTYNLTIDEDPRKCDQFIWTWKPDGSTEEVQITKSKRCEKPKHDLQTFPNYNVSVDGRLAISNVTRNDSRKYRFTVHDCCKGFTKHNHSYSLHVQVPVSQPLLNVLCLHDGGANVTCGAHSGDEPQFSISVIGHSLLENVSRIMENVSAVHVPAVFPRPWNITCSVSNRISNREIRNSQVKCPVPLSVPVVNVSCQLNGSARAVCEVEEDSNATFTWTVNGELIHQNSAPSLMINASYFASGAINVTCSAENAISEKQSNETEVFCDAPVSEPVLNASCLSNGTAVITCWLLSGTNPEFNLTVNGQVIPPPNISSSLPLFKHIISSGDPWNISCFVKNKLGVSMTNISSLSCSGSSQTTCMSCLQKSVIGGVVALIVTISPLLIAGFYIGHNTRQDQ